MSQKRTARPDNEDEFEELLSAFNKSARLKALPRDVQCLKTEMNPENIEPKDAKRVPKKPNLLEVNLGKIKKPPIVTITKLKRQIKRQNPLTTIVEYKKKK